MKTFRLQKNYLIRARKLTKKLPANSSINN